MPFARTVHSPLVLCSQGSQLLPWSVRSISNAVSRMLDRMRAALKTIFRPITTKSRMETYSCIAKSELRLNQVIQTSGNHSVHTGDAVSLTRSNLSGYQPT